MSLIEGRFGLRTGIELLSDQLFPSLVQSLGLLLSLQVNDLAIVAHLLEHARLCRSRDLLFFMLDSHIRRVCCCRLRIERTHIISQVILHVKISIEFISRRFTNALLLLELWLLGLPELIPFEQHLGCSTTSA